ncbi:TfoX/Sxy family DNA transformation protein [Providencia hangzhouensis]|uniref:TfoX/Sxy family DNA transformation protein n=1 Tax=Providencia rettgeri TaxID=587 RepID=A0AAJ4NFG4_PRORE|nr:MULTISPECIES: TfoX/Sxy family DNA transformation protein [Providencia]MBJ9970458.1 TfoX/Sxy family DNA transformation protein [Providencia rettgeri]MCF8962060.1 DNA transformation protein TfoX1 [Providencia rettgeri]QWQ15709.1 TfoX/Sxy family DNA transformation protein [Providencia rettgeri]QWQ19544.1 TfoX/Sxy family DNA transformation protein [Providencia rettgeri]QWQ23380.1 TfoX/Sxy family DNA transformation protein [Providencia rettgeri]
MLLEEEKIFYLSRLLSQFGELKRKNHFGGFCLLVDDAIVGLVLDGCFYLRGCLVARSHFEASGFNRLVYSKKGIPLEMRYYLLSEQVWHDEPLFLQYIELAYRSAIEELKQKQSITMRIKDLPNMNMSVERALGKIGVSHVDELRMMGAKACFMKLKKHGRNNPSIKLLIGLAAAIEGCHSAVLPKDIKQELIAWYNSFELTSA